MSNEIVRPLVIDPHVKMNNSSGAEMRGVFDAWTDNSAAIVDHGLAEVGSTQNNHFTGQLPQQSISVRDHGIGSNPSFIYPQAIPITALGDYEIRGIEDSLSMGEANGIYAPLPPLPQQIDLVLDNDMSSFDAANMWDQEPFELCLRTDDEINLQEADFAAQPAAKKRRKRNRFEITQTQRLQSWLSEHADNPYPTLKQKRELASKTGLSIRQLQAWFSKARQRIKDEVGIITAESSRHVMDLTYEDRFGESISEPSTSGIRLLRQQPSIQSTSVHQDQRSNLKSTRPQTPSSDRFATSSVDVPLNRGDSNLYSPQQEFISWNDPSQNYVQWWLDQVPLDVENLSPYSQLTMHSHVDFDEVSQTPIGIRESPSGSDHEDRLDSANELSDFDERRHLDMVVGHSRSREPLRKLLKFSVPHGDTSLSTRDDNHSSATSMHSESSTSAHSACSYTSYGRRKGRKLPSRNFDQLSLSRLRSNAKKTCGKFRCSFCPRSCSSAYTWARHEEAVHIPQQLWICKPWSEDCNEGLLNCWLKSVKHRTFMRKDNFLQHLRGRHKDFFSGQDPDFEHIAKYCQEVRMPDLDMHCPCCGTLTSDWQTRKAHIVEHVQKGFDMSNNKFLHPPKPVWGQEVSHTRLMGIVRRFEDQMKGDGDVLSCTEFGCTWSIEAAVVSRQVVERHYITKHWALLLVDSQTSHTDFDQYF